MDIRKVVKFKPTQGWINEIRPDVTLKRQLSDDEFDTWMQKVKNN